MEGRALRKEAKEKALKDWVLDKLGGRLVNKLAQQMERIQRKHLEMSRDARQALPRTACV